MHFTTVVDRFSLWTLHVWFETYECELCFYSCLLRNSQECILTDACLVSAVLMVINSFLCPKQRQPPSLTSFPYARGQLSYLPPLLVGSCLLNKYQGSHISVRVYAPGVCIIKNISYLSYAWKAPMAELLYISYMIFLDADINLFLV